MDFFPIEGQIEAELEGMWRDGLDRLSERVAQAGTRNHEHHDDPIEHPVRRSVSIEVQYPRKLPNNTEVEPSHT
jgi:hypothetical protein